MVKRQGDRRCDDLRGHDGAVAAGEVAVDGSSDVQPLKERVYTKEEVSQHNTPSSCWVVCDNMVVDATSWVPQHPGGSKLLANFAGQDITDEFAAFHFPPAYKMLKALQIGRLDKPTEISDDLRAFRELRKSLWKRGYFRPALGYYTFKIALNGLYMAMAIYLFLGQQSRWGFLVGGLLLGLSWQQQLLVAHDVLHLSMVKDSKLAFRIGRFLGTFLCGIGAAWWKFDHYTHHAVTNVISKDPSAGALPVLYMSERQVEAHEASETDGRLPFLAGVAINCQGYTYLPLCLLFGRINLHLLSASWQDLPYMLGHFIWLFALLSQLPTWFDAIGVYLVSNVVLSILHVQLNLNHYRNEMFLDEERVKAGFFRHQLASTANVKTSWWHDWFHGGLQYQVEHHLFPLLARPHLAEVAPMVKQLAVDYSVTYHEGEFMDLQLECMAALSRVARWFRERERKLV
eukprot:scaffold297_cov386-Prasinococcus_capsulatus_cf.AAC.2